MNESQEMSVARRKAANMGVESANAAVERCCCCSDQNQLTPRRSTRLARKKEELPPATSLCCCDRSTEGDEDKENHPSEDPLCKAQQREADEFSLLIETWGMELHPPLKIQQSPKLVRVAICKSIHSSFSSQNTNSHNTRFYCVYDITATYSACTMAVL